MLRAIAPALANVERCLVESALLWVDLPHVREVIYPALLGTRTNVEIDPLDGFQGAGGILATLEYVMDTGQHDLLSTEIDWRRIVVARALQPAFVVAAGFAPAFAFVLLGAAGVGFAPFGNGFTLEHWALGDIDQGIDGARVVDLVVGNGRGVGDSWPGVRKHLKLQTAPGHAGNQ